MMKAADALEAVVGEVQRGQIRCWQAFRDIGEQVGGKTENLQMMKMRCKKQDLIT